MGRLNVATLVHYYTTMIGQVSPAIAKGRKWRFFFKDSSHTMPHLAEALSMVKVGVVVLVRHYAALTGRASHARSVKGTTRLYFFDSVGILLSVVSSVINWYLVVAYKTNNRGQSWFNLASLVLGTGSPLISFPVKSTFNRIKQAILFVIGSVGIFLEALTYYHHIYVIPFIGVAWVICFITTMVLPYKTILDIQVVGTVTSFLSAGILLVGSLIGLFVTPKWEYVQYEAHTAVLEGASAFCDILKTGSWDVLVAVTVVLRLLYAGLIYWRTRSQMQGLPLWCSGVEKTISRKFRSCREIWKMVGDFYGKVSAFLHQERSFISIQHLRDCFNRTPAADASSSRVAMVNVTRS